ncbi:hypothetical protein B1692_15955 [Geobacillus thermoleovorans]|nr:hypothetical protein B1692_15955 [Geobacillus thermoleovorans]
MAVGGNWRACLNTTKGTNSLFCETLDWKAPHLKVLKKYKPEDAQMEEIDEIIDECLAKIATYLT